MGKWNGKTTPRMLIDTNVLISAAAFNSKIAWELLRLGVMNYGGFIKTYEPVITDVVMYEFVTRSVNGLGRKEPKKYLSMDEVDKFIQVLQPMLDVENQERMSIGREYALDPHFYKKSIAEVLEHFSKKAVQTLIDAKGLNTANEYLAVYEQTYDSKDIHVVTAALQFDCTHVVTRNKDDVPAPNGIEVVTEAEALKIIRKYMSS